MPIRQNRRMDERARRVSTLKRLVEEAGGAAALSRKHPGIDPSYVSQLLNGHRAFGERAARAMEERLGLERGELDREAAGKKSAPRQAREPSLTADEYEILSLWRVLFEDQRTEALTKMRAEAEKARRIEAELRKRNLDKAVPDGEVAKHLPPRPAQRELPIPAPAAKRPGKR